MRELVGECEVCRKEIYCEDGFLNGRLDEGGRLTCFTCAEAPAAPDSPDAPDDPNVSEPNAPDIPDTSYDPNVR
ncbi:hypothetical protein PACILC2_47720 [Paenibacillus cisolokensis]|uniref:Uncharacterized protein n=1 Tax=Paenibacillus cisolokensis TaxID=1658519 RepID=A0ABQ4NDB7_9BACL|nr:hypothetical protein [Paenibacillus cisolokensis]GIQ66204.1 hypothetical protein PACILC2_47720 [Paenibacillus cisolokensis]